MKEKDLEKIISELEKKYGVERTKVEKPKVISTGSIKLNRATGINGLPLGKIVEIFGAESSGKSTITLHLIAESQKAIPNKKVALFDYEHSFDKSYAEKIGVNVDDLLIYQPDDQESGYDLILGLVSSNVVSLIVIDSQTAAMPKAVVDGDIGEATIGLQARINSKFCGKIKGLLDMNDATIVFISQTRANIGSMVQGEVTTGGNAIKFYADMRWKVWKMNDKQNEANKTTIDIVKNKLAPPFGQAKIDILWGTGYDKVGEIIDCACDMDIIKRNGSWFTINDIKIQGEDKLKEYFEENPDTFIFVKNKVLEYESKS